MKVRKEEVIVVLISSSPPLPILLFSYFLPFSYFSFSSPLFLSIFFLTLPHYLHDVGDPYYYHYGVIPSHLLHVCLSFLYSLSLLLTFSSLKRQVNYFQIKETKTHFKNCELRILFLNLGD